MNKKNLKRTVNIDIVFKLFLEIHINTKLLTQYSQMCYNVLLSCGQSFDGRLHNS